MSKLTTAVIMAGGQGTRLISITGKYPKAMVNIHGTEEQYLGTAKDTILEHQMKMLSENGITNFILVVGNKKEFIEEAFTNEKINQLIPGRGINIQYFEEQDPLGTGGAFCSKELQDMIHDENFLFTYSDVLFDVNIQQMMTVHERDKADATVLISPCANPDDRPLLVCENRSNVVMDLIPKQGKHDGPRGSLFPNTPKNGLMIMRKTAFSVLPEEPTYLDMEANILTKLIYGSKHKVCAWNSPCYLKDIGVVDRFYEGVADLRKGIPATRNPEKMDQRCVVFNESDLIRVGENGKISLDIQVSDCIKEFNDRGIITLLYKNHPALAGHSKEDMIIDTMLIRDGVGTYVNAKYSDEDVVQGRLAERIEDWNISLDNTYTIETVPLKSGAASTLSSRYTPCTCLVTNLGTDERQIFSNVSSAAFSVLGELMTQNTTPVHTDDSCQ